MSNLNLHTTLEQEKFALDRYFHYFTRRLDIPIGMVFTIVAAEVSEKYKIKFTRLNMRKLLECIPKKLTDPEVREATKS